MAATPVITLNYRPMAVAVPGKILGGGPGPSSFGRQQQLSEITIEPIKNLGGLGKILGVCA